MLKKNRQNFRNGPDLRRRKVLEEELSRIDDDISTVNENIILLGEEQGRIEVRKHVSRRIWMPQKQAVG